MPYFGDLEAAIMNAVWASDEPVRVRDVLERLDRDPGPAYTTVQTVMDILFRKGWLTRVKKGRVNLYAAAASRDDYVSGLMDEALAAAEDRTAALVRFFEGMDPEETATLRRMLGAAKSGQSAEPQEPAR
ncbi:MULTISPECIES: BlaI/MecI/CopY family transcriptional regulator [Streptomycetaceae]|uniref:Putative transcriptional repressor n=1 Tax=Streptantibioticus cattleyicolor (strain ATCC 35852 / DSM 46488 / JCM 4925 / NBRC 14057 / NRRL 8057) TaxID=1003195 RepID=F8K4F5_STREN|nr:MULTISPECIES: BlaI/MecI/CopY family transcriptional regulator [Streptomycetaceae]AEW95109.1 putative transcriptional repressor [Streptantibioticus cattleyicolor NRRL 8057 = DSM 46488]MYS59698.1 BlaI/MecI/CopY family transcriptional regulator [Streptomyces sp. SID5468]CCB75456.1 Transcriptional regulator blaI [Streptantibioticus cattleyicolor NRRL 8057 = DSM 46488]